ncbi:UNVERIFIED_CONTAM: hypothetical protein K2H54_056573 [Gekko kuhli]
MGTVWLNIPQVESKRLSDIHEVGEVQANTIEKNRGHDDFINGPHIFALRRMIRLPPSELNAKLSCIFRCSQTLNMG